VALTGVFTATATPSPSTGGSGEVEAMHKWTQSLLGLCALAVIL
jgi:hypothetical protein